LNFEHRGKGRPSGGRMSWDLGGKKGVPAYYWPDFTRKGKLPVGHGNDSGSCGEPVPRKRSGGLLKNEWGEELKGSVGCKALKFHPEGT